jgi:competence protein ComEA
MQGRQGVFLLVLLLLIFLSCDIGRHVLVNQDVPAFFVEERSEVQISLEGHWEGAGVLQISDGLTLIDVINLTDLSISPIAEEKMFKSECLRNGERFVLQVVKGEMVDFFRGWMPAAQRVALGIPLHPDRMTVTDWDYLPGAGKSLAGAIEADRQKNGDYLDLDALKRVSGVGKKRIAQWEDFF